MFRKRRVFVLLVFFIAAYLVVTFSTPPDPTVLERYGISAITERLLRVSIALPLIMIWWIAFYGFSSFKKYAFLIKGSADGKAHANIANGLAVLAIGLPISTLAGAGLRLITKTSPAFATAGSLLKHYLGLFIAVVAFFLIGKGARQLLEISKQKPPLHNQRLLGFTFLAFGSFYAYLILNHSQSPANASGIEGYVYHMPLWLVITTVILPYLYVWYKGLMAAFYIDFYKNSVSGKLYRNCLRFLAWGIGAVVISSVLLQYFGVLSEILLALNIKMLLVLIYALLVSIAVGYVLIAKGARKLQELEEV